MTEISTQRYFEAIDATWAPAGFEPCGAFTLRRGLGGGKRVSAATLNGDAASVDEINAASNAMIAMKQDPLFMLKPGQGAFDDQLASLGFEVIDPVILFACPAQQLARHAPDGIAVIPGDLPLAAQKEIWATDNIGSARIDVMARSADPKAYLLGRHEDKIAGTVFVSCDGDIGMLHALTVSTWARRNGVGKDLTCGCARWAMQKGATTFALMTTEDNIPARQLYEGVGMLEVSRYHYRIKSQ